MGERVRSRGWRFRYLVPAGALVLTALVVAHFLAVHSWRTMNQPYLAEAEAIRAGMTEMEVIRRLGVPYRKYGRDNAPWDYYVPGYEFKRRKINGEVLIYTGAMDVIVYVYIDRRGKVEDTFIGGS